MCDLLFRGHSEAIFLWGLEGRGYKSRKGRYGKTDAFRAVP
jgi:hypothetical protein